MFYEHIILAKKGPLARIWLAAHWDKKITKAHVFETNIEKSVEGILQPKVKLALRTSGHLLLGVVRIYSRKAKYLLADCNEAFVKIKMAFRPGMVDLPEGHREAHINAITLPEVFHDFDTALPELNDIDIEAQFSVNQSRADEITMREDYGSLSLSLNDDGFGDIGFEADTPDIMRGSLNSNVNDQLFVDEVLGNVPETHNQLTLNDTEVSGTPLDGEGFGDVFGQPDLFEDDLFGEHSSVIENIEKNRNTDIDLEDSCDEDANNFEGGASPASVCKISTLSGHEESKNLSGMETLDKPEDLALDQSTLLQNEEEGFALAPVDASAYKGVTKPKRKRKLIVDEIKNISGEEMKAQLADTSDIITTLDLAPPTKRLMYWKETGGVEKLFALPSRKISARALFANYHRHLVSHSTALEDFSNIAPADILALDQYQNENDMPLILYGKRGRKRKLETTPNTSQNEHIGTENNSQNIVCPEQIREQESSLALSHITLDISKTLPSQMTHDGNQFNSEMHDINEMTQTSNMNVLPLTPRNVNNISDVCDDYHHGDISPLGMDHGHLTPNHSELEAIDSIPNLPEHQVSSILNEAAKTAAPYGLNRSSDISNDWNDFDFPYSVGIQNVSDEQMENETDEQFEERVLNKRAAQLFYVVRSQLAKQDFLTISDLTAKCTRKQAAQKFYSLLVLKKFRSLNLLQSAPYADITITRGPMFENPKL